MGVFIGITVAGFIIYLIVRAYKKQKAFDKALNEKLEAIYAKLTPEEVETIKLAINNEKIKKQHIKNTQEMGNKLNQLCTDRLTNPAYSSLPGNIYYKK